VVTKGRHQHRFHSDRVSVRRHRGTGSGLTSISTFGLYGEKTVWMTQVCNLHPRGTPLSEIPSLPPRNAYRKREEETNSAHHRRKDRNALLIWTLLAAFCGIYRQSGKLEDQRHNSTNIYTTLLCDGAGQ
jgi:hypothetical protein